MGEDEILLRVEAAAICGTDLKIAQHGHRKLRDGQTIILGHEFVGRVEKVGRRVKGYDAGMRMGVAPNIGCGRCEMCGRGLTNMCPDYSAFGIDRDGAQTEYVKIPAAAIEQGNLVPIGSSVPATQACLAEPLSCAISGVRAAQVKAGDCVIVFGAGPMGLLNVMVAGSAGASRVVVVDPNSRRLEAARKVGATDAIDPAKCAVKDWVTRETKGRGVDAVIAAAPSPKVQQDALELLAPFGRLCLFAGLPRGQGCVELDTNAIHYKQLIVTGMTGGSPADYRQAVGMIESGRIDVSKVISDVLPIGEVKRAYERAMSGQGMKIVMSGE
jgi:threonine dehydrogenase-like Zn-dependent dehydrogenase